MSHFPYDLGIRGSWQRGGASLRVKNQVGEALSSIAMIDCRYFYMNNVG